MSTTGIQWPKYPLKLDPYGIYVLDSGNNVIFNFIYEDEEFKEEVVRKLNGEDVELEGKYDVEDQFITKDGKHFLLIRSWGKLTGHGYGGYGLDHETAMKMQDELLEKTAKILNGV